MFCLSDSQCSLQFLRVVHFPVQGEGGGLPSGKVRTGPRVTGSTVLAESAELAGSAWSRHDKPGV